MITKNIFFLLLIASTSFAQTKTKRPRNTASFSSKPALQAAKATAEAEVVRLENALADAAITPNLVPCDYYAMKIQLEYQQWFLAPAHYQELEKMSRSVDAAVAAANAKLASLENESVNVLVGRGQNARSTEAPVAFKDLITFFRLYSQRMNACPKDQREVMMKLMEEEPQANPMHIVLSQVRAAGGMMTVNLNASLQEQDAIYTLLMKPREDGYDLELEMEMNLNGLTQVYRFSLLGDDHSSTKVELSEKAKWAVLSKGYIDGMPIDGLLRYRKIQNGFKVKCESFPRIPSLRSGLPHVQYAELPTISKELENPGSVPVTEMEFVKIAAGTFQMGSPPEEGGRNYRNEQQQAVTLNGFEMQTTEVTQSQWYEVMKSNPSYFVNQTYCPKSWRSGLCLNHPVEQVSWNDVQDFIRKLNQRNDGYVYRLPTEQEWEYAARGGTTTPYWSGEGVESLNTVAWLTSNAGRVTHSVASANAGDSANAYGLYDMHGNVREWTQDLYRDSYRDSYSNHAADRCVRGGSFGDGLRELRSAYSFSSSPDSKDYYVGFRLVRTRN